MSGWRGGMEALVAGPSWGMEEPTEVVQIVGSYEASLDTVCDGWGGSCGSLVAVGAGVPCAGWVEGTDQPDQNLKLKPCLS